VLNTPSPPERGRGEGLLRAEYSLSPRERAGVRGSSVSKVFELHDPLILSFSRREKEPDFFSNLLVGSHSVTE